MGNKEKLEVLVDLVKAINGLGIQCLGSFFAKDERLTEIHITGDNIGLLPKGDIHYEIFDKSPRAHYPWRAFVVRDGIKFGVLITDDDAWALYV